MRTTFSFSVAILLCLFAPFGTALAQPDTLTFIHVNDSHSNLLEYGDGQHGGMARAASIIGQWKQLEPNPVLLHGGDLMVGTLMFNTYFGVPELQLLNSFGFDAMVLGNHEFDVGPEDLGNILTEAQLDSSFDIISSNAVNLGAVPALDSIVKDFAIEERGSARIGIVGLTTPITNTESNPFPVVLDTSLVEITMQKSAELRAMGCNVIILLTHLGLPLDMQIAQYPIGVDAIIGGHTHTAITEPIFAMASPLFRLEQNYPNPFNPETTINFTIDGNEQVTLVIFDLLGRELRRLAERQMAPGSHAIKWDGRDSDGNPAPSGFYIYRLQTGHDQAVRRMLLLR